MKRRQLLRHLRNSGCELLREGGKHSWWHNPVLNHRSAIPRHVEIVDILARKICRELGVGAPNWHPTSISADGQLATELVYNRVWPMKREKHDNAKKIDTSQNHSDQNTKNTENDEETDELTETIGDSTSPIKEYSTIEENRIYNFIKVISIQIKDYPLKILVSFVSAPIALFSRSFKAEDKTRKLIAIIGLLLAFSSLYVSDKFPLIRDIISSFLHSTITSHIPNYTQDPNDIQDSPLSSLIQLILRVRTSIDIIESYNVISQLLIFWIICFLFLQFSSNRMASYIRELFTGREPS